jgi:hypothetical protein
MNLESPLLYPNEAAQFLKKTNKAAVQMILRWTREGKLKAAGYIGRTPVYTRESLMNSIKTWR